MSEGQPPIPPHHGLPQISQPFPGSLTPGWNDPPSVQYNPTTSGGTPGRTKLNKRVPFPLQQSNITTTKPTAIVQPCTIGPQPMGIPSNSSNIAVVHPLQHTNTATPPILTHVAGAAGLTAPTTTREISSQNIMPPPQTEATLPTMFVPAVPRQHPDAAATQTTVQHL